MENKRKRNILGLDIGVASVGWAVMQEYEPGKWTLHDFGVRMFDYPVNPKERISLAEERRSLRSKRRLTRRRQERIKRLKKVFDEYSLVSQEEIENHFKRLNDKNDKEYKYCDDFNPYIIRYNAVEKKQKISSLQLLIALINICKSRGYDESFLYKVILKSDSKKDGKEDLKEDFKKDKINGIDYKESVSYGYDLIREYKYPITALYNVEVSERKNEDFFITGNRNFKDTEKNRFTDYKPFYFPRSSYINEVREILQSQKDHLNLKDDFIEKLIGKSNDDNDIRRNSIIFSQRDFEDGPGDSSDGNRKYKGFLDKLGKDIFYNETRMWKSSLEVDLFFIINELSKISFLNVNKETLKKLFKFFYDSYLENKLEEFLNCKDISKKNRIETKKLLNIFDKYLIDSNLITFKPADYSFFLNWCNSFLKDDFIKNELAKYKLGNGDNKLNELGKIIAENITPSRFVKKIKEKDYYKYFDFEKINRYINERKKTEEKKGKEFILNLKNDDSKLIYIKNLTSSSTSKISKRYFDDVKKAFLNGDRYGDFQAKFSKKKIIVKDKIVNKPFGPILDPDIKDNPVVSRSLAQSRKVVKALYEEYGWFDQIIVETARDLSKSVKEKDNIIKENEENYERNLSYDEVLKNYGIISNFKNREKIRLLYEQKFIDPYTLKSIEINKLNFYDIEHIIPKGKFGPDIFDNKVLVSSTLNQNYKGKNLPLEIKEVKEIEKEFSDYVRNNENFSKRKKDFLLLKKINPELLEGFSNKELTDTRYISKYFTLYLNKSIELYKEELKKKEEFKNFNFEYEVLNVKGQITSTYRKMWLNGSVWGLDIKPRDITNFHHAIDAIILANFKSLSTIKFYTDIKILLNAKQSINEDDQESKNYFNKVFEKLQEFYNEETGEVNKIGLWYKNAPEILNEIKDTNYKDFKFLLNKYLKPLFDRKELINHIDKRIPVVLKIIEETKNFKQKNKQLKELSVKKADVDVKEEEVKDIPIEIKKPEFVKIISEQNYDIQELKKLFPYSNIRYPMISWKSNNKIDKSLTGSKNLKSKKEYEEQTDKKNIRKITKNNSTDYIDVSSYYGTVIYKDVKKNKFKFKPIRNIVVSKTHKYINCKNILRRNTYFEVKNNNKLEIWMYTGQSVGLILYVSPLLNSDFVNKLKTKEYREKYGLNYRLSPSNNEFKIIKYDILGRKII